MFVDFNLNHRIICLTIVFNQSYIETAYRSKCRHLRVNQFIVESSFTNYFR